MQSILDINQINCTSFKIRCVVGYACRVSRYNFLLFFSSWVELNCHWTVEIEKFQFGDQRKQNIFLVNERKLHGPNECKRNTRTHVNQNMLHSINTTIKWVFIPSLIARWLALSLSLCRKFIMYCLNSSKFKRINQSGHIYIHIHSNRIQTWMKIKTQTPQNSMVRLLVAMPTNNEPYTNVVHCKTFSVLIQHNLLVWFISKFALDIERSGILS